MFIYIIYVFIVLDKRHCCFFTDPGNPGNIIGRVTHKSLDINKFGRLYSVFLAELFGVIIRRCCPAHSCDNKFNRCVVRD